jgi:hypothetical protein
LPQHHEAWIAVDRSDVSPDKHEQVPASSPAEPSLSVFVEMAEVCPALSRSSSIDVANGSHDDHPPAPVAAMTAPEPELAQPKSGGYHIAYPDRSMVISRYKEKRKNRM